MKKLCLSLIMMTVSAAFAAAPHGALMVPQYGTPVRASIGSKLGVKAFTLCTGFVESEGATAFTAMVWLRWAPRAGYPADSPFGPFVMCDFTTESARSTSEGGPSLVNLSPVSENEILPLVNGRWSANCLPQTYDHPDSLDHWQYGCYCINITTDTGLTLNVAGEELYIPATNGMVRTILATTASRSVSIVAESASANVKFGIAETPLVQFVGANFDSVINGRESNLEDCGLARGEWRLVVFRASIVGNAMRARVCGYNAMDRLTNSQDVSQEMWHQRTTIEKNSRFRFMVANAGGLSDGQGNDDAFDIYGFKCYRGDLSDRLVETMRDQDVEEMMRRGIMAR